MGKRILAFAAVLALLGGALMGCSSGPSEDSMVDSQKKLEELNKKDGTDKDQY